MEIPATWAVVITSEAADRTRSFYRFACGPVVTDPAMPGYLGAEAATSMTAEITAQAMAAQILLTFPGNMGSLPVDMIFDNKVAADFARSVARSKHHEKLLAVLSVTWQMMAMHASVAWRHTYSHAGEILNELVDNIATHAAHHPEFREPADTVASTCCRTYGVHAIKLLYLLRLPERLASMHPDVDVERTAIQATPSAAVKWALPAKVIAANIDQLPRWGTTLQQWEPLEIDWMTYNPTTMRKADARISMEKQLTALVIATCAVQEARTPPSSGRPQGDDWWVVSFGADRGHHGCELWIALNVAWAVTVEGTLMYPQPNYIHALVKEPKLLLVRIEFPAFSILVVVPHGPYCDDPKVCVHGYWKSTSPSVSSSAEGVMSMWRCLRMRTLICTAEFPKQLNTQNISRSWHTPWDYVRM